MYQKKQHLQNSILLFADMISIVISYIAANWFWIGLIKGTNILKLSEGVGRLGMVLVSFVMVIVIFNGNKNFIKRKIYEEFFYCAKINIIFAAAYAVVLFIGNMFDDASRGVYVCTVVFNVLIMFSMHVVVRYYLIKIYKKSKKNTQMFVITTAERSEHIMSEMKRNLEWVNRISGMAIIDCEMVGKVIDNVPVAATKEDVVDYIKGQVIDEVFIDIPHAKSRELTPLVMELENMGVTVHLTVEELESFKDFNKSLSTLGDIPVVTFANRFYDVNKLALKRIIDIVGSLVGIVITLILSIFIAPAILIESRGPLIFKQKRVGKNGRFFYVYKFRSMYKDAEERKKALMEKNEMKGHMFKMTDDPRITKVGKFIRKTSLDELPQFFNVLKGDMSLVGTRPPTVEEFKEYEGYHKRRLSMKPGITGMWQVSGRSNIEDFEDVVRLDLEYIDKWSIGLDFKILLKTVGVIFTRGGAK